MRCSRRCATSRIAGAGLDVWAKEPPPPDHPLLQFDNVLASPHTAGVTKEARDNMGQIAAEQMLDALDGKRPPRIVNPGSVAGLRQALRAGVRICAEIAIWGSRGDDSCAPRFELTSESTPRVVVVG